MEKLLIPIFFLLSLSGCEKDVELMKQIEWERIDMPDNGSFTDIHFLNADIGYILVGYDLNERNTKILKTIDGGSTWNVISSSYPAPGGLTSFYIKDEDVIYATGFLFYKSDNGGRSWTVLDSLDGFGRGGPAGNIHFLNDKEVIITKSGRVLKSYDGGHNFEKVYDASIGELQFTSDKIGYIGGGIVYDATNYGKLVKTTDRGDSWQRIDRPFKAISAFSFVNDNTGYVFINLYKGNIQTTLDAGAAIYKTEDGGNSWQLVDDQVLEKYGLPHDAYFLTEQEGYFSSQKKIFHTTDGGKTWTEEANVGNDNLLRELYLTPSGKGIAIGKYGLLLKQK